MTSDRKYKYSSYILHFNLQLCFSFKSTAYLVIEFFFFFTKKNKSMLACRVVGYVSRNNQIAALGYVTRTNHIAALGYVTRTSNITAFGYHAPITPFGYCFFVNDVMESEGCSQRMTLTGNLGSFAKCYDCGLRKSLGE